ncbi:MAG: protein phosphatase 2C domain-containing protein [Bacteroidales bacterium]
MTNKTTLQIVSSTDKGMEREHNEDYHGFIADVSNGEWLFFGNKMVESLSELGSFLIVADGMGGTNAGEVAAELAVHTSRDYVLNKMSGCYSVSESDAKTIIFDAIKSSQNTIVQHQKDFPETEGMGTTLVLTWIIKNKAYIAWVGDSRCYVFNQTSGLKQLSKDHSYVQELVDSGKLSEEQAFYHPQSNIITQSLGDAKRPPIPGFVTYNLQTEDSILMCSDGLNGMITDSKIEYFMRTVPEPKPCADLLIDEANKAGGHDNITVLIAFAENVNNPLPPVIQKSIENPVEKAHEILPAKKSKKLWVGIIIGLLLALLIVIAVQFLLPDFSKNKMDFSTPTKNINNPAKKKQTIVPIHIKDTSNQQKSNKNRNVESNKIKDLESNLKKTNAVQKINSKNTIINKNNNADKNKQNKTKPIKKQTENQKTNLNPVDLKKDENKLTPIIIEENQKKPTTP